MSLTGREQIELYRRMLKIRLFEQAVMQQLEAGLIPGPVHLSIGQEAAIAGACMALRDDDFVFGTHRSHGHPIGKGAALPPLMAELMGRRTGVCKGKGGSMHLADHAVGVMGESGIVGAGIPLATGAGLSARVRGTDQATLCFFGDGASNEGSFHESLNLAAIWKLPVVFLCENNLYGATTAARDVVAVEDIADRAAGYGIPGEVVDGQDAVAVRTVVERAVARARRGEGPSLVEAKTYRYGEHAEGFIIPALYRDQLEIDRWKERDPLEIHRRRLLETGVLTEQQAGEIEAQVARLLEEAAAFAERSDFPEPGEAFNDVYADPGSSVATLADAAASCLSDSDPRITARSSPERQEAAASARVAEESEASAASEPARREITYFQAIFEAHQEEMARDERVVLIGEDLSLYTRTGLLDPSLAGRVFSAPISENGFSGMGVGAALTGLRPIVDLTIASLVYLAMDQIVNQAAKLRYMTGGQACVPIVFRAALWHAGSNAAHHSDRPYPMLMSVPGLKLVVPASPSDVKGLLKSAIRDDDPVFVFEDHSLWFQSGPVPGGDHLVPIGVADVRREGSDVTLVTIGSAQAEALGAAQDLSAKGISVEVIDPRTLAPLDEQAILNSVAKTGRLVVVDPASRTGGAAAEIAALVAEKAFDCLKKPIVRVTTPDVPVPFSPALEKPLYPSREGIAAAIERLL